MQRKFPVTIMRGGTSRALFFQEKDLPQDLELQDRVVSLELGSPDPYGRQINGLGGATSSTSKVAVISPRTGEPNTINYTFCQVSINNWLIDRKGNCGNISSAVGPYAIDEGMEDVKEPVTLVRIFNTNTQKYINALVPVENGKAKVSGDYAIAGIPGSGAKIGLEFQNPGGSVTGKLLPTGNAVDVLETGNHGPFAVSIVDVANPLVFVKAADLGLWGTELPPAIDSNPEMLAKIESIRAAATVRVGLAKTPDEATQKSPAVPKIAFVSPAVTYASTSGVPIKAQEIDVTARIMSMGKLHSSYPFILNYIRKDGSPIGPDQVFPLAMLQKDYGIIAVRADSKYQTLKDLLDAVKANPANVQFVGGGAPGTWDHLNIMLLAREAGVDVKAIK